MSMNRRSFLTVPLLALGAGICTEVGTVAHAAATERRPLRFALLRLAGSNGTAADAQLHDNAWENVEGTNGLGLARITLRSFVPASLSAPKSALVQSLFGDGAATAAHDLYRYFASDTLANGKAVGFDAVDGAFAGFRLSLTHGEGEAAHIGEFRMPALPPGLYALLLDDVVLPQKYAFSGDLARPLAGLFGIVPNHLCFSVAESV